MKLGGALEEGVAPNLGGVQGWLRARWRWITAGVVMAGAVAAIVWAVVPGRETIAPFAYHPEHEGEFQRAGAAGEAHLVYANSPGGALATARRVARLGPGIDAAARAGGVATEVVEGMVFLESGGLPDVVAGGDPKGAAGVA